MAIPLMMYGPGIPRGEEICNEVSILDIAPTIVRGLGIEEPDSRPGKESVFSREVGTFTLPLRRRR